MSALFETRDLVFTYPAHILPALNGVTLDIAAHSLTCLIGPNGSGKSTLLRLLLGTQKPDRGTARFEGKESAAWDRREIALRIGVVPQLEEVLFPFTVEETVNMGRYPHLGPWRSAGERDRAAVQRALERCAVVPLSQRSVLTLSGGERQRVRVARALAQEPAVLVLDEPTASLDLGHEMALFELMADLRARDGVTVIAATHNINHAARFATHIVLIDQGKVIATGTPREVITREQIAQVYRWPVSVFEYGGPGADSGAPQVSPLRSSGLEPECSPRDH